MEENAYQLAEVNVALLRAAGLSATTG